MNEKVKYLTILLFAVVVSALTSYATTIFSNITTRNGTNIITE